MNVDVLTKDLSSKSCAPKAQSQSVHFLFQVALPNRDVYQISNSHLVLWFGNKHFQWQLLETLKHQRILLFFEEISMITSNKLVATSWVMQLCQSTHRQYIYCCKREESTIACILRRKNKTMIPQEYQMMLRAFLQLSSSSSHQKCDRAWENK